MLTAEIIKSEQLRKDLFIKKKVYTLFFPILKNPILKDDFYFWLVLTVGCFSNTNFVLFCQVAGLPFFT